jgi:uncharacterized protein YbjT (DUF2867 family)
MKKILVIGSSGFVGGAIARALLEDGHAVRCLARDPAKVRELAARGGEVVQGDMTDRVSLGRALDSVDAAYIAVHTLSPQGADTADQGFMDIERQGVQNIVAACRAHGVRRLIYVTFLGTAPDGPSAWARGRWQTEQLLLRSGLEVTVIRPGQIVGVGGQGFDMLAAQARRSTALVLGSGRRKFRPIALDDLVYYLVGVLDEPRAYGQGYDVGSDDILTTDQLIDVAAASLGRPQPRKIHVPRALLGALAPLVERLTRVPRGALSDFLGGAETDLIGDPAPLRTLLPRQPLPYRQAVERALTGTG